MCLDSGVDGRFRFPVIFRLFTGTNNFIGGSGIKQNISSVSTTPDFEFDVSDGVSGIIRNNA